MKLVVSVLLVNRYGFVPFPPRHNMQWYEQKKKKAVLLFYSSKRFHEDDVVVQNSVRDITTADQRHPQQEWFNLNFSFILLLSGLEHSMCYDENALYKE